MIHTLQNLGVFGTNCYIVPTDKQNAVLVDAPCYPELILDQLKKLGLSLKLIILTHGHCDHIGAAESLRIATGARVLISEPDSVMLKSPKRSLADYFHVPFEAIGQFNTFADGEEIKLDDLTFKALYTPGHTLGSACFIFGDVIFTGDTLFAGSVGRTDFENGRFDKLIKSISRLYDLGRNYTILCGHGEPSDLYYEKLTNPFLGELRR